MKSVIWGKSDQEFKEIVDSCKTYTEILAHFGLMNRGNNHKTLKKRINKLGIHFVSRPNKLWHDKKPLKEILVEGSKIQSHVLKKRLIEEGIFEDLCHRCNNTNMWLGEYLSLHLDHINGDPTDNRIENLRLLCPNCHSQTETYCGKAKRLPKKLCIKCLSVISRFSKSNLCVKCARIKRRDIALETFGKTHPSKEELEKLIEQKPITQIGKIFGVSGNAITKWMKRYGIPKKYGVGEWAKITQKKPTPSREELEKNNDLSSPELERIYKVGENLITKWYRSYGIKRPDSKFWANKRWSQRNQKAHP